MSAFTPPRMIILNGADIGIKRHFSGLTDCLSCLTYPDDLSAIACVSLI